MEEWDVLKSLLFFFFIVGCDAGRPLLPSPSSAELEPGLSWSLV